MTGGCVSKKLILTQDSLVKILWWLEVWKGLEAANDWTVIGDLLQNTYCNNMLVTYFNCDSMNFPFPTEKMKLLRDDQTILTEKKPTGPIALAAF